MKFKWLLNIFGISILCSCGNNTGCKEIIYVPVKDTINDNNNVKRIIELEHIMRTKSSADSIKLEKIKSIKDSLQAENDSLAAELFVAKYKLERIKYYNSIAKKGNNLKYLRGWINRVFEN